MSGSSTPNARAPGATQRVSSIPLGSPDLRSRPLGTDQPQRTAVANPEVIIVREGGALPEGYTYATREPVHVEHVERSPTHAFIDTVVVSPLDKVHVQSGADAIDASKSKAAARRNLTRNINKKANASFVRNVKDSLATGKPIPIDVSEGHNDLKTRWHAAAKESAYKLLDLRKEGWKDHSLFDKTRVRNELNEKYHFEPPIEPKKVDKYLAGHLRTSRAVWKAHWLKYGDLQRHPNCPEEAWATLIKWWPTQACMERAQDMAARRSLVQNASKNGRVSVLERMDEEVSPRI